MIGVITALPVESVAVRHVLGDMREVRAPGGDPNQYVVAELPCGPVVTTVLTTTGNSAAAHACAHLVRSFPRIETVIMCGIALGVPRSDDPERDVRLGDVVVGTAGVVHYSHVRVTDEGVSTRGATLVAAPRLLRGVNELRAAALRGERPWRDRGSPPPSPLYERPPAERDVQVFHGRIGSGDELLRSARRRDELARREDLLAIEMEAAGVAVGSALDGRGCLVVRGVSDYGDAAKSDLWQPAASLAAAAYVRALLDVLPPSSGTEGTEHRPLSLLELVTTMERVPSLRTPQDRDDVLRLLGPPVEGLVKRDTRTRAALLSLASVCGGYPTGLTDLLNVLELLEGADSSPVRALADAIERYRS
ncbi:MULTISPECIES: effector-associated domain 2-containing protein [Nonomuraea]|uniref:Nucleoside phosphorylase domain-containing protein n=1 Tax=Nonomuraea mangrovi TaxID=2316207 RepID=A0ABW4TCX7_9ACTN